MLPSPNHLLPKTIERRTGVGEEKAGVYDWAISGLS
jgi:hypothetical protein